MDFQVNLKCFFKTSRYFHLSLFSLNFLYYFLLQNFCSHFPFHTLGIRSCSLMSCKFLTRKSSPGELCTPLWSSNRFVWSSAILRSYGTVQFFIRSLYILYVERTVCFAAGGLFLFNRGGSLRLRMSFIGG